MFPQTQTKAPLTPKPLTSEKEYSGGAIEKVNLISTNCTFHRTSMAAEGRGEGTKKGGGGRFMSENPVLQRQSNFIGGALVFLST